jgi:hypothetical protein
MPASQRKVIVSKFPLRLMPSVRKVAEDFSRKEGVSLNQFINIAVAEKLAHLQHEDWLSHRPKASARLIASALDILDRPGTQVPDESDRLPPGYVSGHGKYAGKRAVRRSKQ